MTQVQVDQVRPDRRQFGGNPVGPGQVRVADEGVTDSGGDTVAQRDEAAPRVAGKQGRRLTGA